MDAKRPMHEGLLAGYSLFTPDLPQQYWRFPLADDNWRGRR